MLFLWLNLNNLSMARNLFQERENKRNFEMNKKKKIIFTGVMGGLTSIAVTGCVWQTRRYQQSKDRWAKINQQIDNFEPEKIEEVPW